MTTKNKNKDENENVDILRLQKIQTVFCHLEGSQKRFHYTLSFEETLLLKLKSFLN